MEQSEWEKKINRAVELSNELWGHADEDLLGDPLVEEAADLLGELAQMVQEERLNADFRINTLQWGIQDLFQQDVKKSGREP